MNEKPAAGAEIAAIRAAVARLRAGILATVVGAFLGTGLAVATLWLVIRGGPRVGQHLGLLRHYLPGFTVSVEGALLGFVYGAVLGALLGWSVAWIYNRVVDLRS